jgi:ABC-type microcin C transport system permease subunit YejE
MTPVHWDDKKGKIKIRPFDIAGLFFLALFIISRAVIINVLSARISSVIGVAIATYSIFCGVMIGRLLGLFGVIHRIHIEQSQK